MQVQTYHRRCTCCACWVRCFACVASTPRLCPKRLYIIGIVTSFCAYQSLISTSGCNQAIRCSTGCHAALPPSLTTRPWTRPWTLSSPLFRIEAQTPVEWLRTYQIGRNVVHHVECNSQPPGLVEPFWASQYSVPPSGASPNFLCCSARSGRCPTARSHSIEASKVKQFSNRLTSFQVQQTSRTAVRACRQLLKRELTVQIGLGGSLPNQVYPHRPCCTTATRRRKPLVQVSF